MKWMPYNVMAVVTFFLREKKNTFLLNRLVILDALNLVGKYKYRCITQAMQEF